MSEITRERLFGFRHAFDNEVTIVLTVAVVALLLLAPLGAPLNFAQAPNNREGWSQIVQSVESSVRALAAQSCAE